MEIDFSFLDDIDFNLDDEILDYEEMLEDLVIILDDLYN
jgi:hypothetical protein